MPDLGRVHPAGGASPEDLLERVAGSPELRMLELQRRIEEASVSAARAAHYSSPDAPHALKTAVIQPIPRAPELDEVPMSLHRKDGLVTTLGVWGSAWRSTLPLPAEAPEMPKLDSTPIGALPIPSMISRRTCGGCCFARDSKA